MRILKALIAAILSVFGLIPTDCRDCVDWRKDD